LSNISRYNTRSSFFNLSFTRIAKNDRLNYCMKRILLTGMLVTTTLIGLSQKHSLTVNDNQKVLVYTTANNTSYRLTLTNTLSFKKFDQPLETDICIFVDDTHSFQTFLGIGGAITDAVAETFAKLPEDKQKEILTAYYDSSKGIGYTLARTNINSCDFSSDSYDYINEGDSSLQTFSVAHDEQYRIPFIKQAIATAGGKLCLFASPWSPPAFMKDNNDMLNGGKLKPAYYQAWANYYVKFIKAYERKGIPVWGLTVQNEPMAKQRWESCLYTAQDEANFIKNYLGPTLQKEGLADKKIIAWDHNRDLMYQYASTLLNDDDAAKYIWGIGFHWYETWTGSAPMYDNEKQVQQAFPDTHLLFTEGCNDGFDATKLSDWKLGEHYGKSMINDFNNGTIGWTDWNILLDENGGPNHVGNFCFAPVYANPETGELTYTNAYYYIGQFSKFIRPGAKRITSSSNRDKLLTTAFKNIDGSIIIIVMNQSDDELPLNIWIKGKALKTSSLARSIATFVIQ
jgi:glucosylceramidase